MTTNGHEPVGPRPVPDLTAPEPPLPVTDEERNRFGSLLDAAAERGLLSPGDYQARLAQVADAGSVAELQRIVTELPAFGGTVPPVASGTAARTPVDVDAVLWAGRTQAVARRGRGNQWLVLAVVVGVLLVALVALGLVAAHIAHDHSLGGAAAVVTGRLSSLRL